MSLTKIKEPDFIEDLGSLLNKDLTNLRIGKNTENLNLISEFKNIQRIWLHSFDIKNIIKISPYIKNVKLLSLYGTKEQDLSFLENFKEVEDIRLNWNTKATKLWKLNNKLRNLTIIDFPKLADLTALNHNERLEYFALEGGMEKPLKFESVEPITKIKNLKHLRLFNIKLNKDSLEPLFNLKQLKILEISNQFPTEEYAKLSMLMPEVECSLFKSHNILEVPIGDKDVMITGRRKPLLNSVKDKEKIEKYELEFNKFRKGLLSK